MKGAINGAIAVILGAGILVASRGGRMQEGAEPLAGTVGAFAAYLPTMKHTLEAQK